MIAVIVLTVLVVTMAFSLASCRKDFDYNKAKLSKYVYVPEEIYTSYNVALNIPEITDFDVDEEIIKIQCDNKITPDGPIYSMPGVVISAGDVAGLYYRGYTIEDGVKKYFDTGCNFAESDNSKIEHEIGGGSFVPGFESGLIGKSSVGYATLTRAESGIIQANDIISLTYSVVKAGGASLKDQTVLLDLSDKENIDKKYGEGFTNFLIGKNIDANVKFATGSGSADKYLVVNSPNGDGQDIYLDMSVSVACRTTLNDKLVVEVKFPYDYSVTDLAGKTGYFEIYIQGVRDYITPEFTDEFITDTLKFTADDLSGYEGANLVEKYKCYIKDVLNAARDAEIKYAVEDSFWAQLMANAEFKKIPESEIDKHYNEELTDLSSMYEDGYKSYYKDLDTFARAYLELSSTADWRAYLRADAEQAVKQRLAFYYIVQKENLHPNDEEYAEIYEQIFAEHLQEYLDYYSITESSENYESQLEYAKKVVKATYGDAYWDECVLYDYVIAEMISRANITFQ